MFLQHTLLRALGHITLAEITHGIGLLIHGKDAGIESLKVAEEVGSGLNSIEFQAVIGGVVLMRHVEIELPTRVGPHLIEAGIERVGQCELSARGTIGTHGDVLTLHNIAVRGQQLNIEVLGIVGGLQIVGPHDVGLVPQRVAEKIAVIVRVDIDFLLHLWLGCEELLQVIKCISAHSQRQEQEKG